MRGGIATATVAAALRLWRLICGACCGSCCHRRCAFVNTKQGRGLGAKNPKPSHSSLVLGLSCQTAVVGGIGCWWDCLCEAMRVVGLCIHKHKQERGVRCQKPETEPASLGFRSAMSNDSGERWRTSVGLFVRNDGGCGVAHSQTQVGECGWGSKTRNPA